MNVLKNRKTLAVAALAAGFLLATLINTGAKVAHATSSPAPDAAQLTVPSPQELSTSFARLAKELEPSVVQVTSTIEQKQVRNRNRGVPSPFGDDGQDFFRRFFGNDPFAGAPQPPRRAEGTGSGFIVDKNGYILTNYHVVDGATRVRVQLHGENNELTAKVIGSDPELDLAVIKVDADKPLTPVHIGNSDGVQVGDWAVAIGSPFGLEASVTAGIISAKGRAIGDRDHQLQRFLQTDAAINPGNSGGPLLNINGQVIGVNTMIATNTGAFQGIGFALPINLAVNSYNQIIKSGKVSRGAIGITFPRDQKPELLKAYGGGPDGVFVNQVNPGTPAAKAGIKEGDIITTFNGKHLKDGEELVGMVSQTPVGSRAPITVLRDGKSMDLNIEIGDRAAIVAGGPAVNAERNDSSEGEDGTKVKLGLSVRNLGANERSAMHLTEQGGVAVTDVEDGSLAESLGIQDGDVILAVNRQTVANIADLRKATALLKPGDAVAIKALRNFGGQDGGWTTFFAAGSVPR